MANDLSDYNDWRLIHINTDTTNTYDQLQAVISRWREHYHVAGEVTPRGPLPESLKTPVKWKQDQNAALFGIMSAMQEFPGHTSNAPDLDKCWLCKFFQFEIILINWDAAPSTPANILYLAVTSGSTTSHIRVASTVYETFCDLNLRHQPNTRSSFTLRGHVCLRCSQRYLTATGYSHDDVEHGALDTGTDLVATGGIH